MSGVVLTAREEKELATIRQLRVLAGPEQARILISAVLVFLFMDFIRLTSSHPVLDPLGSVMDGLSLVALVVLLWRPRLGLLLAAIPLVTGLVFPASSMEALLLALVIALGCAQLPRQQAIVLSLAALAFPVVRSLTFHGGGRVWLLLTLVIAWAVGMAAGWTALLLRERRARAARSEAAREREAAKVRADERSAISRELHDVVVHNLSTISLQLLSARQSGDVEELHDVLEAIEGANQEALNDVRLLVSVLRDETLEAAPGVELAELTQRVPPTLRAASAELELVRAGFEPDVIVPAAADHLPMTVQNTVSRVIAEAVSNVLRHAPLNCRCTVRVISSVHEVTVQVRNPVTATGTPATLGWGLRSLQERIKLTGGSFHAGAVRDEWVVSATLPVD
ncbi:sensor histidine kinase [Luteococcus sp.]|uniref:sensor histidine kinase n=1 Tax=Luteococcus sp. TaxID=1969402 RepID=UPI0037362EA0